MTEEQNKLAEEIERQLTPFFSRLPSNLPLPAPGVVSKSIELPVPEWHQIIAALREPATEAVLEEAAKICEATGMWAIHGANSLEQPITVNRMFEETAAAIRALKGKGASQGDEDAKR